VIAPAVNLAGQRDRERVALEIHGEHEFQFVASQRAAVEWQFSGWRLEQARHLLAVLLQRDARSTGTLRRIDGDFPVAGNTGLRKRRDRADEERRPQVKISFDS
jgi:hypothetical protein